MAPIKFEEDIKDKIEKRTLSPSAGAWSKLSERLDEEDKASKKSILWWLSIAAGLLIMIAITVQFFNGNDTENVIPQVVNEEVKANKIETKPIELETQVSTQLVVDQAVVAVEKEAINGNREIQTTRFKKEAENTLNVETKLVEQNSIDKEEILNKEAQDLLNEAIIENAVTDALDKLGSENTTVTDKEIDSLLKQASKELFKYKLQKETSKAVDADALLQSVEEDMGQSFRSKVFDALKGGYETVKTAVAERNN